MSTEVNRIPLELELDAFFAQYTACDQAQCLLYGLVGPGGLRHTARFTNAAYDNPQPSSTTVFPIASMTKSFVACAALIARDRGLLSLDDPITKYFPEFRASGTFEDPCDPPTLAMLLSMTGGLTEDNSWLDPFIDAKQDDFLQQVYKGLRYSHVPGSTYEYSNLGFTLAGLAVGRAAGRTIEDFVTDEVLRPLGLESTFFDNAAPVDVDRATGYWLDGQGRWTPYPPTVSDVGAAAGGLMSTVQDLATWITWLGSACRAPRGGDVDVLGRASRREMQRLRTVDIPSLATGVDGGLHTAVEGYGLGLKISVGLHRGTIVSHGGGLPGFRLHMCWHPDSGHGMVVLTNSQRGKPSALCTDALCRVLARDKTPAATVTLWPETVRMREAVERLVRQWDDDLAMQIFAENVDFDRPLAERRAEIEQLVSEIGPLGPARPATDIVSAATGADVTWSISGKNGDMLCMIHLTPVEPPRIQELVVEVISSDRPRSAQPIDISPRRSHLGEAFISPSKNVRVQLP